MIRWLRVVLPFPEILLAVIFTYAALELPVVYLERQFGARLDVPVRPSLIMVCFATAVYGAYWVWAFHPNTRPGYRNWLTSTPWTSRKPLPLGPVQLVWQDVVALVIPPRSAGEGPACRRVSVHGPSLPQLTQFVCQLHGRSTTNSARTLGRHSRRCPSGPAVGVPAV